MKTFIEWNKDFETNIPEIDEQHKVILNILNEAFNLLLEKEEINGIDKNRFIKIILELKDYTKYHFQTEEVLFDKYNFEEKDKHKAEHDFFIKKVDDFLSKDIAKDNFILLELIEFLKDWLINHILITDRKYINKLG